MLGEGSSQAKLQVNLGNDLTHHQKIVRLMNLRLEVETQIQGA